ncbi:hypothetical protein Bbelb_259500 [Branchiostoma belcheri]|nr:hypothetical protein Bbelb_259500 [Branchiostoma belcheri]
MDVKLPTLTLQLLYFEYAVLTTAWLNRPIPVLEHDNVTLLCAVEGTTWAGQRIDWYYNSLTHIYRYEGQDRHIGYGKWATRAQAGAPFQLTIRNVTVSDDGYYTCDVGYPSSGVRRIRSAVNVAVPVTGLQVLPLNTTFMEGTVADVSCFSLGGKPAPNLHWVNKTGALTQEHETQLKINITAKYNQNRLVCEAEQDHPLLKGHRIQQEITLSVLYGPRVKIEVKEGRNLTITFRVNANPPPMYATLTKGKTLNVEQKEENILEYTKINVNKSDAGIYLFTAANSVNRTVVSIPLEYHCDSSGECGLVRQGKVIPTTEPTDNGDRFTTRNVIITSSVIVPTIVLVVCLYLFWRKCGRKELEYSPHHDSTDMDPTPECKNLVNPDDVDTPSTLLQYSV